VYSIFFLETVQTILSGADLYHWFAADYIEEKFITPFASFFDLQILGSVVSLSVQFFFVHRIRVLSRLSDWEKQSRWLCVIICLVTSSLKFQNDLFISQVALCYWCNRGIYRGYHCDPPLFTSHITCLNSSSRILRAILLWNGYYKSPQL
jgi:hypothetical protein